MSSAIDSVSVSMVSVSVIIISKSLFYSGISNNVIER